MISVTTDNRKFYLLKYKSYDSGFFCHFFYILGGVNYCIENNFNPIVDWTHIFNIYGDSSRKETNPFEYFFNQKFTLDLLSEGNYITAPDGFSKDIWPNEHIPYGVQGLKLRDYPNIVSKFNKIFTDFFSIKDEIFKDVNKTISDHKTLGIHCRRSDMVLGHPEHALVKDLNETYQKVLQIFESRDFKYIYLATEENDIIDFFKLKFGDKLLYQENCWRADSGVNEWCWYNVRTSDRENHNYLKGKEVLLDSINLSLCDSIICSISNVSYGSIIFNNLKYNNIYYFDEININ
jgi:hypothetical protein